MMLVYNPGFGTVSKAREYDGFIDPSLFVFHMVSVTSDIFV